MTIYRPLRDRCHEIRVLEVERPSNLPDEPLRCRMKYMVLYDDSADTTEDAFPDREQNQNSGTTEAAYKERREQSETIPNAYQMHYATILSRQRKTKTQDQTACEGTPSYIALSYTWGDTKDLVPIQVENSRTMVTRNLHDALVAIRSEPGLSGLPVWADAVCLNQSDHNERSNEVKRIFEVYRRASKVVVWLGHVPTTWNFLGMRPAGDINQILPPSLMRSTGNPEIVSSYFVGRELDRENNKPEKLTHDEFLTAVAILDWPYWKRIWILQELVMADPSNLFFFWAQNLRHISVLCHVEESLRNASAIWFQSPQVSGLIDSLYKEYIAKILEENITDTIERIEFEGGGFTDPNESIELEDGDVTDDNHSLETSQMLQKMTKTMKWSFHAKSLAEMSVALREIYIRMTTMMKAASFDAENPNENFDFSFLIGHALKAQCTEKLDLVYGLLGLHWHDITSQITPDYSSSLESVFTDFSAAAIRMLGLNYLCAYEPSLDPCSSLPSWAVDLSKRIDFAVNRGPWHFRQSTFRAGGATTNMPIFIDKDHLRCEGRLYEVDLKTPQPRYRNPDLIREAFERVFSSCHRIDLQWKSILNISPETMSDAPEAEHPSHLARMFWQRHSNFVVEGRSLESLYPEREDVISWDLKVAENALSNVHDKYLLTTADGRIGLSIQPLTDGDEIAILRGCNLPVILREHHGGYKLVGMCYLDGLMFGEVFEDTQTWEELSCERFTVL